MNRAEAPKRNPSEHERELADYLMQRPWQEIARPGLAAHIRLAIHNLAHSTPPEQVAVERARLETLELFAKPPEELADFLTRLIEEGPA